MKLDISKVSSYFGREMCWWYHFNVVVTRYYVCSGLGNFDDSADVFRANLSTLAARTTTNQRAVCGGLAFNTVQNICP